MTVMKKLLPHLLLLAAAQCAVAASPNLLVNGDFASGRSAWQDRTSPAQSVVVEEASDVPGGGPALRVVLTKDGGKNHGQLVQFRQGVKPNARYRVSALVKSDAADMAYVQVKLMKGKGEGTRFSTGTAKAAGEWTALSADIPTAADTTGIQVLLRYRMNAGLVGKSVRFAQVALVGVSGGAEGDEPPPPPKKPEPVPLAVANPGTDQYVTPAGAGAKDGTSWDNARPGTQAGFAAALAALGPGNTLRIAGGDYPGSISLSLAKGGESLERPLRIVGEDRGVEGFPRPVFRGSWVRSKPSVGPVFLELRPGAGFIVLENLDVRNYRSTLIAHGPNHGLRIRKVDTCDCRDAYWIEGGMVAGLPESGTSDLLMEDCSVVRHTKKGVRTLNGLHHSKFVRVRTDAGGKEFAMAEPKDVFSGGFHVLGSYRAQDGVPRPDHHIEFIDCQADNNYHDPGPDKSYWNADGFCSESATHDITFLRCRAFNNTDGGWDIKTTRPAFIDCIGIGNKRNYRVWTKAGEPAIFRNCLSAGAVDFGKRHHHVGFWLLGGGEASLSRCTSWGEDVCLSVEKGETTELTLDRCLFVPNEGKAVFGRMDGDVRRHETGCVFDEGRTERLKAPALAAADPGDAFDCVSTPGVGYRHQGARRE